MKYNGPITLALWENKNNIGAFEEKAFRLDIPWRSKYLKIKLTI